MFASWFDVDAACAVAGAGRDRAEIADGLARLAEHSLLVVERGTPTRYRALETIRQFGVERLDQAGELDQTRAGHERFCRLAVAALRRTETADIDEAWCDRFDRVADDVAAALSWCAGDESAAGQAATLAGELAGLLFLRGRPAQAQRRYEQAADLAVAVTDRVAYLRLAAGSAASRFVGDDALRLSRMAADAAVSVGDRSGAARDLATMAMYINRAPGIMATPHPRAEADVLVAEARALSDGSPLAQAALAVAEFGELPTIGDAQRVAELAERAGDGVVHSIALDQLTLACLVDDDIAEAVRVARRRLELLDTLPVGPLSGFELGDGHLMAAEVDLAAGDLAGAAVHAEALAGLPFYRDEDHLALSRRLLVDALAGHFDDLVRTGERFRTGWERAGRPVAPNLARTSYAVAMVHGLRGDDDRRAAWVRLTIDLGIDAEELAGHQRGWPPVLDSLLALHRDDPATAVRRLAADIDDPELCRTVGQRTVAAVVCRAVGGGRRPRPPPRSGGPDRPEPARRPGQPDRDRDHRARRRDPLRRSRHPGPSRDHLRPARLPLPAGKNRQGCGRTARSAAPVAVNARPRSVPVKVGNASASTAQVVPKPGRGLPAVSWRAERTRTAPRDLRILCFRRSGELPSTLGVKGSQV